MNAQAEFAGNGYCSMYYGVPAITDRYVSFDGTNEVLHQHFSYVTNWPGWSAKQPTVTTYALVRNTNFQTIYSYGGISADTPPNSAPPTSQNPVEPSVAYYDPNGSPLKTVSKTWANIRLLGSQQTTFPTNQTSKTAWTYNSNELQIEQDDYDFGAGAPGSFLRATVTDYATFGTNHIVDKPSSVIVYSDAAKTIKVAETDFTYDNPVGTATSGIVQHVTGCNCGNLTQESRWVNSGGTTLNTTFTNDDTGQRLSMTDPRRNQTTYSYADSYSSGTPPGPTNAYLTTVTHRQPSGVNHIEHFAYAYASGEVTSSTDQNNLVTTYKYVDNLARLTETDFPDGGVTTIAYNDNAYNPSTPSPSVTTTKKINTTTNLVTLSAMDGLGHVLRNELTSDPQGTFYALSIGETASFTGLNLTHIYNSRLQPSEFKASSTGGNAIDITYSFVDPSTSKNAGHVYSITNNLDSTRSQTFSYDQLNRITAAQTTSTFATSPSHCWGETYQYDGVANGAWGNLTQIAATTNSTYIGCTQESGFTKTADGNNHLSGFGYDSSGNATSDGVNSYTWDAESQLKTAAGVTYLYDGSGRRVSKSNGKLYWYGSGGEILAETDANGNNPTEYIFFGGQRVAMLPATGNPIYYVEDLLGTSRVITSNTGVVCYDADFYPYGGERTPYANTCTQNNYKFEGKERDTETGNDDFGARYYSNRFGRWLSADWSAVPAPVPYANLTNPQTLNLYSMVADDPESFADLDGHECTPMPPVVNTCASNNNTPPTTGEGATQAAQPMSTADKAKLALDVVGFVPVVGDFANAASAVISLAQGHLGEAALSAVAAIPLVGAVGEAGKDVKLTEEAAKLGKAGEEATQIGKK